MKADDQQEVAEDAVILHLPTRNRDPDVGPDVNKPTRYAAHTGGLPRLTDDPEWRPNRVDLPEPVNDDRGLWDRLREALGR